MGTRSSLLAEERFVILIMEMDSWVYTYVKTDQTIHFKLVPFHVLQLDLNKAEKIFLKMPNPGLDPKAWRWEN